MSFKPEKAREINVIGLEKGQVVDKSPFSVSGTPIPNISEKLVRSLGKFFDCSFRDKASLKSTFEEL